MERSRSTEEVPSALPGKVGVMEELLTEPLPSPWSYAVTDDGRVFFVNEESHATTWIHPVYNQPIQTGLFIDQDLPDGWEVSLASGSVPYYIDHFNRSTTFQRPVPEAPIQTRRGRERKSSRFRRSSSKRRSGKSVERMASVKRDINAPVSIKGWLNRQEGPGPFKSWKRRWCVLADFCLFVYKDANEDSIVGTVLLPSFKVNPCVKEEDGISKRCAFKAEHENVKTSYFFADTEEEMIKWIDTMRAASSAEFHAVDEDDDVRFPRSQSQNAISNVRPTDTDDATSRGIENWGREFSQYDRRQNSMPSGIDSVRQNRDESRLETSDLSDTRPQFGRDGGGPRPNKDSNLYVQDPSHSRQVLSSSSDDDFMYMKDLNASLHAPSGAVGARGNENGKPMGGISQNEQNLRNSSHLDGQYKGGVSQAFNHRTEPGSSSLNQGRTLHIDGRSGEFSSSLDKTISSDVMSPQPNLSQKQPPFGRSMHPGGPSDGRPVANQDQNFGFGNRDVSERPDSGFGKQSLNHASDYNRGANPSSFQSGNSSSNVRNHEAEILEEIRNQKSGHAGVNVPRAELAPDARLGVQGKTLDQPNMNRMGGEMQGKHPTSSGFQVNESERHKFPVKNAADLRAADQLRRLEVQKPMSRVEEWTMEQVKQQQEAERRGAAPRNDEELHKHRYPNHEHKDRYGNSVPGNNMASQANENRFHVGSSQSTGHSSPTRTNAVADSGAFGGVGGSGQFQVAENLGSQGLVRQGQQAVPQGLQSQEHHMNARILPPTTNQNPQISPNQHHPPSVTGKTQDMTGNFNMHPLLTSSQDDLAAPKLNAAPSALPRMSQRNSVTAGQAENSGFFGDINRLLVDHAKLVNESSVFVNNRQPNVEDLIKHLVQLRRSQTKLEENRYWILGQIHGRLIQPANEAQSVSGKALQDKLTEVERQIANTSVVISGLDHKLTNLRSTDLTSVKPPSSHHAIEKPGPERQQPNPEKQQPPLSSSSVVRRDESKGNMAVDTKLQDLHKLKRQVEHESAFVNNLREEKSKLEKGLAKATRDEQYERDPNELIRVRRQKQAIDRELYSLQTKLTYAVRNLDDIKDKCAKMDHELNSGNRQEPLAAGRIPSPDYKKPSTTYPTTSSDSKTNLPTDSITSVGDGSTYFETDLDTGICRNLAAPDGKSIPESHSGSDLRLQQSGKFQNAASAGFDHNREITSSAYQLPVHHDKGTSVEAKPIADSNKYREPGGARHEYWSGGSRELVKDSSQKPDGKIEGVNPASDSKFQGRSDDRYFYGSNSNTSNFPVPEKRNVDSERNFSGNPGVGQQPDQGKTGFQSQASLNLRDDVRRPDATRRSRHEEFSTSRMNQVSSSAEGSYAAALRQGPNVSNQGPSPIHQGPVVSHREQNLVLQGAGVSKPVPSLIGSMHHAGNDSHNKLHASASFPSREIPSTSPVAKSDQFFDVSGQQPAGRPPNESHWNPAKPPRLANENWERQKETERNVAFNQKSMHGQRTEAERKQITDAYTSSSEENITAREFLFQLRQELILEAEPRPRSKSLQREDNADPTQPQQLDSNNIVRLHRLYGNQGAETDQNSPTGDLYPRDHIRRLSGFFTPKPFRGGQAGTAGSAKVSDDSTNFSPERKDLKDSPLHQNQNYNQHIHQIFNAPKQVEIPDRYNGDADIESLSPEEAQWKREKSEKLRKMVAAQSLQQFSKGELTVQTGGLHYRVEEERRRREQMLDARQMLAEQVSRRTRQGSESGNRVRTVEDLLQTSDDGQYL